MSTPTPHDASPASDATVVRTGRRGAAIGLPVCLLLGAFGLVGLVGSVMVATSAAPGGSSVRGVVGVGVMLVLGALGVVFGVPIWKGRNTAVTVDGTGVWLDNGRARQVVPWTVLAGVGVYWSRFGRGAKQYSVELCPNGPIDDRDPVLWALVRDEEPLRPDLPRLRYRLPVPAGSRDELTAAIRRYAPPQLWFGEVERKPGHLGRPDPGRRPTG